MSAKNKQPNPDSSELKQMVEEYKRRLKPEDLKWYEENHDLVPMSQIIAQLKDYIEKEGLQGTEE